MHTTAKPLMLGVVTFAAISAVAYAIQWRGSVAVLDFQPRAVRYSPDGTQLLVAKPQSVTFWDAKTLKEKWHPDVRVDRAYYSGDGKTIALVDNSNPDKSTISEWSLGQGKNILTSSQFAGFVSGAGQAAGDAFVEDKSELTLCDLGTGSPLLRWHDSTGPYASSSDDLTYVAVVLGPNHRPSVWNTRTRSEVRGDWTYEPGTLAVQLVDSGRRLATQDHSSFSVWNVATGKREFAKACPCDNAFMSWPRAGSATIIEEIEQKSNGSYPPMDVVVWNADEHRQVTRLANEHVYDVSPSGRLFVAFHVGPLQDQENKELRSSSTGKVIETDRFSEGLSIAPDDRSYISVVPHTIFGLHPMYSLVQHSLPRVD